jgi:dipeptidyl aminopeptidase/acylaminoacyl peptidase
MRLVAGFFASFVLFAAQPITITDLLKIRRVTSVEVARDGSFAVYGVQSIHTEPGTGPNAEPTYGYRTHLFSIDLRDAAAKPVQLTFGDRNDADFGISPDGKRLALVRPDPSSRERTRNQVWLMPLGTPGEAEVITKLDEGATSPRWRPDGKALLVTSVIPISKIDGTPHFSLDRPQRQWFDWDRQKPGQKKEEAAKAEKIDARPDGDRRAIRNWLEKNAARDNPTVITRMNFLAEMGLQREMSIAELFLIELDKSNKATQLTRDFYTHADASFSPDSRQIVFTSTPPVSEHPDRLRRASIYSMNSDGTNARPLLDNAAWSYRAPRFTEDGKALIVTASEIDEPTFRQAKLMRYDLALNKLTRLAAEWDSSVTQVNLASDGRVMFRSAWHGGEPLMRVGTTGGNVETLVAAPMGVSAFDEGGGKVVAALIEVANPNELYLLQGGSKRRLTDLNASWLAQKTIVKPVEKWITRPDGTRVQYWVMNPSNTEQGKKYPWILEMHGGPSAMWGPGEFTMWHEFQLLCSWGYGITYSNPRGSGGYGYKFQKGNFKNWGDGPAGDVLSTLDETLRENPLADRDRLFLTGGSYAGYLTAWIVGHDHRFKAAAALRGVYELSTFFGEGNAYRLVEASFGGFPWDSETKKLLDRESPFSYVKDIRTPLLIQHGSNDLRTGVTQSEMLYRALQQMGKPVEYLRYPNIGHELTRSGPPLQRMDHMLRIIEFFERYSKNDRPAPQ